jgi:hypothetical protein
MKRERSEQRDGEGTKFTIDRKIFSSDIWFASPWKLKIWIYLIGHANHKDNRFMGIPIKRGQLIRSYRKIAKDCAYKVGYRLKKPSPETIRRICEELTKEERIRQRTVHCGTLITICNYDQDCGLDNSETVTGQDNNEKNHKNEKKIINLETSFRLASYLREKILANDPKARVPENLHPWGYQIDLLIRKDQRRPKEVEAVIEWSQGDPFWRANILSARKLREKFPQLKLQMERRNKTKGGLVGVLDSWADGDRNA